ncbi:MAG: DUF2306 domain-containing protein [Pirellulaceae bacterium]
MNSLASTNRTKILQRFACYAVVALALKILIFIIIEYRFYFPADFDAAFLVGREKIFHGVYRSSFYLHLVTGPICILLAVLLVITGPRRRASQRGVFRPAHRIAGRVLAVLVLCCLLPTGLVMAQHALAGPIAALGFTMLSLATAATMCLTIATAIQHNISAHRRWATRCFILLMSPLFLRFVSGALQVTNLESDLTYRLNAWLSWLVPLIAYECWRLLSAIRMPRRNTLSKRSPSPLQELAR